MLVQTTRFGTVDVDEQRIIVFSKGILGFPQYKRYVLIQPEADSYFYWLQAMESPDLGFIVTDPSLFVPSYRVPLKNEQMEELGIDSPAQAQVLVIVNKHGHMLTGNLQGPLVIHVQRHVAEQMVLSDRRFHTRVPLVELPMGSAAMAVA